MRTINRILTPLIIVFMTIAATSCGEDFDYDPQLENRTIYHVDEVIFNADVPETIKEDFQSYFDGLTLIIWDNGKYQVNVFSGRETTEPRKPKTKDGKVYLSVERRRYTGSYDETYCCGTITLTEVGHNRYDCKIYDNDFDVTFSVTLQFDEGIR